MSYYGKYWNSKYKVRTLNISKKNPFVYKDPIKASLAVSAILHRLYIADMPKQPNINNSLNTIDMSLSKQAVENLWKTFLLTKN